MKLSIIIVTWNSAQDIESCLDSLSFSSEFETIVIDNASTDNTREKLARYCHLTFIANSRNVGYARANNQGIARAKGEYVLLLNPDTRSEPGTLDTLAGWLDVHPEAAAVAPRLVNPDGTNQLSIRALPTSSTVLWEITGLARLFPRTRLGRWRMSWFDYERPAAVEQPMASCLMVRRAVFQEIGGLDEALPIYYNDVDFSRRMLDAGLKTWYVPDARVFHRRGASTGQVRTKMIWEMHRSLFHYLAKHDKSRFFQLKAVFLLPALEVSALCRVLWSRLTRPCSVLRHRYQGDGLRTG